MIGSRQEWTPLQREAVARLFTTFWIAHFQVHHGCGIGADERFHELARAVGATVVGHPIHEAGHPLRADLTCDEICPVQDAQAGRIALVEETWLLLATPSALEERPDDLQVWQTIRYSRHHAKARRVIYPDGSIDCEREVSSSARDQEPPRMTLF